MTQPDARRRWLAIGTAAVAAIVIVIVIVATAGGSDAGDTSADEALDVVASTAPPSTTTPASSANSITGGTSDPTATATAPTAPTGVPATTAGGGSTPDGTSAETGVDGPAAPTTAPSPGSLVTVPTGTVAIADPIPPDEVGDFGTGVTAEIVTIEAVEGVAQLPGEISGPALRVRVQLTNDSDQVVNLSRVLVDVTYGPDRTPGLALGEPGAEPFIGELASGRSAEGVYVFRVPDDERGQVQVYVSYDVEAPTLVFEGPAPRA
jgi:hypothetical protein